MAFAFGPTRLAQVRGWEVSFVIHGCLGSCEHTTKDDLKYFALLVHRGFSGASLTPSLSPGRA